MYLRFEIPEPRYATAKQLAGVPMKIQNAYRYRNNLWHFLHIYHDLCTNKSTFSTPLLACVVLRVVLRVSFTYGNADNRNAKKGISGEISDIRGPNHVPPFFVSYSLFCLLLPFFPWPKASFCSNNPSYYVVEYPKSKSRRKAVARLEIEIKGPHPLLSLRCTISH
jgi:hypothetical protein